ncbi:MAG: YfcE family phosphodiesterase [Planctomycetota bacterium]|nr:MAG: YfcE family phosphodiesterase [Planctomycetota bacterium]REJ98536.1 MAG: YfcE family phosphodiesterase [Planctomycetota bacterium]REK29836.1 MAG: YfcE family phosphodiesterase [Planctomycetota bacterium]REK47993.1 MAG: YfcE family phosphodiesterase [Planctomycetota bacterium]
MLLGVVSDSHGHVQMTSEAIDMLTALEVEHVIHCGDIGSEAIIPLFEPWPTQFVLGNVDYHEEPLARAIEQTGQTFCGRFGTLELAGRRIAFLHGDDTRRLGETIESGEWDLVCSGHTHVAAVEQYGRTLALNPGAIYRANPHSIAVVELPEVRATIVPL